MSLIVLCGFIVNLSITIVLCCVARGHVSGIVIAISAAATGFDLRSLLGQLWEEDERGEDSHD